jgi:hypothetical protein
MTERWDQKGCPHAGYEYQGCEDSGGYDAVCEMCGNTIRYIHHISHPTGINLGVGCVCASTLTNNYDAPRVAERKIKPPAATQIANWVRGGWKVARHGGYYRRMQKMVVILKHYPNGYSYLIKELDEDKCSTGEHKGRNYETMEDAKIAAYLKKKEILVNRKG